MTGEPWTPEAHARLLASAAEAVADDRAWTDGEGEARRRAIDAEIAAGTPAPQPAGPSWWPAFVAELVAGAGSLLPYNLRLLERMTAEIDGDVLAITLPSPPLRRYVEQRLPQYWEGAIQWA